MMPQHARIVIVGSGIAGASIALHLARLGWRDVVVLEQGEPVSGTTSHAPGLIGQLRADASLVKLLMYSVSLYRTLRVDGQPGFFEDGGIRLASSKERLEEIRRQAAFASAAGLEAHLIGPREVKERFPLVNLDGVEGGLLVPSDGSATAPILARAMINEATALGVAFHARTRVQAIEKTAGRVRAVVTSAGRIETETLVVACGIWSPLVAGMAGVAVPLVPIEHQYVVTAPIAEIAGRELPNLRDPDKLVYMREKDGGLSLGGYEPNPRPFRGVIPDRADPTVQEFDGGHFDQLLRAATQRVPAIGSVELTRRVNGLESFTPDGGFLLGPSRDVPGLWVACGFCAHGISGGGGVGRVIAEWIVNGQPSIDVSHLRFDRFGSRASDRQFVERSAVQTYSTYYSIQQ